MEKIKQRYVKPECVKFAVPVVDGQIGTDSVCIAGSTAGTTGNMGCASGLGADSTCESGGGKGIYCNDGGKF